MTTTAQSTRPKPATSIGMIFLIDIDGWARSARIQIVLGKDYRGRGYSRDAMPRVMTFGFAPEPAGLGMHRIWVGVPEKNTRSISVVPVARLRALGHLARRAVGRGENNKYQDLIVMDTLGRRIRSDRLPRRLRHACAGGQPPASRRR